MGSIGEGGYCFEGFRLDARTRQVFAPDGSVLPLSGKPVEVLLHLAENSDRVVGKDELLSVVWAGRVVEENSLAQAVSAVRRALGTGAGDHRFVLTVPGQGYRFVAALDPPQAVPTASPSEPWSSARVGDGSGVETSIRRGRRVPASVLAAVVGVGLLVLLGWVMNVPPTREQAREDAVVQGLPLSSSATACAHMGTEASRVYQSARYQIDRLNPAQVDAVLAALERAVELDPACAPAYADLADVHLAGAILAVADPRVAVPKARMAARRALALDPNLPRAHLAQARVAAWVEMDGEAAGRAIRSAMLLAPHASDDLIMAVSTAGLVDVDLDIVDLLERVSRLDPQSPRIKVALGALLQDVAPERALTLWSEAIAAEPGFWMALFERSHWLIRHGEVGQAIADLEGALAGSQRNSLVLAFTVRALVQHGDRAGAQRLLDELVERSAHAHVPGTVLAVAHSALGDHDRGLAEIARARAEGDLRMAFYERSASLAPLRHQASLRLGRVGDDAVGNGVEGGEGGVTPRAGTGPVPDE